jgi:carboxyl-terminal processing protease
VIRRSALLAVVALALAACSLIPAEVQRELLPSHTAYKTAEAAFQIIIERHVDKPASNLILTGALSAVMDEAQKEGVTAAALPPDAPRFSGNTWSDFSRFSDRLDAVVKATPNADRTKLERAAVEGMAKSMNECHTYYLDPDRAKRFNQPSPPITGIGVTINKPANDPVEIVRVIPGTPAERAGVKAGDKVFTVDGVDVTNLTTDEVAQRVRGLEGTQVTLGLRRGTQDLTLSITRARFAVPLQTDQMLPGNIGYIEVPQLVGAVADEVAAAVRRLDANGAEAMILDLRSDPGGDLSAAIDIASIFVRQGPIAYQTGRDGNRTPLDVNRRFYFNKQKPLVVLVNKNSASGAEIIAAGIRANDAGTIIGTQTAGCVGTGQPRELPDGGLLLVTITKIQDARTGAELNGPGKGVVPDQVVDQPSGAQGDPQRDAAVAYLRTKIARTSAPFPLMFVELAPAA